MQVYRKILVTIDCSPVDEAILRHVSALARQNEAQVFLLHVVHSHTLDQERALREKAQACLQACQALLRAEGVRVVGSAIRDAAGCRWPGPSARGGQGR